MRKRLKNSSVCAAIRKCEGLKVLVDNNSDVRTVLNEYAELMAERLSGEEITQSILAIWVNVHSEIQFSNFYISHIESLQVFIDKTVDHVVQTPLPAFEATLDGRDKRAAVVEKMVPISTQRVLMRERFAN